MAKNKDDDVKCGCALLGSLLAGGLMIAPLILLWVASNEAQSEFLKLGIEGSPTAGDYCDLYEANSPSEVALQKIACSLASGKLHSALIFQSAVTVISALAVMISICVACTSENGEQSERLLKK